MYKKDKYCSGRCLKNIRPAFFPKKAGLSLTGFNLLEIIFSMLILSLVTAGMFGLFITSAKFIVEAGHRLQAINYARTVAEYLKVYVTAFPGIDINTGTPPGSSIVWGDPSTIPGLPAIADVMPGTTNHNCSFIIIDDNPGPGMKNFSMILSWDE